MNKHTPGPWAVEESKVVAPNMPRVLFGEQKQYSQSYFVCQPAMYTHPKGEELTANIYLIAAAPLLLEACQVALDVLMLNVTDSYCEHCDQSAPKDQDGRIIDEIPHADECPVVLVEDALSAARGLA